MIERTIEVERMEHVISVFGSFDQNLRIIEEDLGVRVQDRDDIIHISGEAEDVMHAEKAISSLLTLYRLLQVLEYSAHSERQYSRLWLQE